MALALSMLAIVMPGGDDPCQTTDCHRRVAHRLTVRRWWSVVRPYRGWLAKVRWCESTNRYNINTGNGFYGAYQFTLPSWRAVGGRGLPHLAIPLEQDYRAVRLLRLQGRGAWPVCG